MSKAYDELMDKIEVTPEMRRRILQHIEAEKIAPAKPKVVQFPSWRIWLSAAACLALVIAGAAMLPLLTQPDPPGAVQGAPNIEQAQSLFELSELVGFEVSTGFTLPFAPEETVYYSYWNELAQIQYAGEGQTATYRQSAGSEDNSGDYTVYRDITDVAVGGLPVTLKGDGDVYALAIWTDGSFSYSLGLSRGVPQAEWLVILAGVSYPGSSA